MKPKNNQKSFHVASTPNLPPPIKSHQAISNEEALIQHRKEI